MCEEERLVSRILVEEGLDQTERSISEIIHEEVRYNKVIDIRPLSKKITNEVEKLVQELLEIAEKEYVERVKEIRKRVVEVI